MTGLYATTFFDFIDPSAQVRQCSFYGRNTINPRTVIDGNYSLCTIGYATTIGSDCSITGDIRIGNYCQLGYRLSIKSVDHPLDRATIFSNHRLLNGIADQGSKKAGVSIGSDVWVGDSAIILKGVHIGNGAVIGASTVVTKDVPDYAIVVGNPARIVRTRFDQEIIRLFNELRWWDLTFDQINSFMAIHELFAFSIVQERDRAVKILEQCIGLRNNFPYLMNPSPVLHNY
jgi:virginiamycin A acetyltransferase